ncbi:NYN domain-containing protein [Rhizobium sp. BK251]|nr:NYN domain-containing protein [Rhizobium sp. BK251]
MPSEPPSPRLAVLIDADNTSAKIADGLFEEVAKIGEASVRRIYGDFSGTRSRGWAAILAKHAIIPQQQFAYTTGKNVSDITLVIDVMDLLHSGRFDGFCLVSSGSRQASANRASMFWVRGAENAREFSPGVPTLHLYREPLAGNDQGGMRYCHERQTAAVTGYGQAADREGLGSGGCG